MKIYDLEHIKRRDIIIAEHELRIKQYSDLSDKSEEFLNGFNSFPLKIQFYLKPENQEIFEQDFEQAKLLKQEKSKTHINIDNPEIGCPDFYKGYDNMMN